MAASGILAAVLASLLPLTGLAAQAAGWSAGLCQAKAPAEGARAPDPQLRPRDDAPMRPDFVAFRSRLRDAVANRDAETIVSALHVNVKVAFDGSGGIEAFKQYHLHNREEDFWGQFGRILALGGTFRTPSAFDAPYTFSEWPDELDAFECLAVVGTAVRVRAAPRLDARTLALVDFAIVQRLPSAPEVPGWQRVRLAKGRSGYIASRYVRSPIDHRALFEFIDGRWWLVAFVAGD